MQRPAASRADQETTRVQRNPLPAIPAAFFGMPLGVIALGIAWRSAASIWPVPARVGDGMVVVGSGLWALLFVAYVAKWIWRRNDAEAEFEHAVQCCFVGLAGVVASLASIGLAPLLPRLAFGLFVLGTTWTLAFAVYRTGRLWMGNRKVEETTPVLYLPTVAGGFVTASAAMTFGYREPAQLAFGAGLLAWVAIESVIIHRLYTAPEMPAALRPALGIQLAPPAVAAVAYLNVGSGAPDLVAHGLIGYALLQALVLLRLWPWLRAAGATPAWWGFSFGAAALPTAAIKLVAKGDDGFVAMLAPWLFAAGNVVILAIATMTVYLLARGRLLAAVASQAAPGKSP
jgi:tellurite resistance protein